MKLISALTIASFVLPQYSPSTARFQNNPCIWTVILRDCVNDSETSLFALCQRMCGTSRPSMSTIAQQASWSEIQCLQTSL